MFLHDRFLTNDKTAKVYRKKIYIKKIYVWEIRANPDILKLYEIQNSWTFPQCGSTEKSSGKHDIWKRLIFQKFGVYPEIKNMKSGESGTFKKLWESQKFQKTWNAERTRHLRNWGVPGNLEKYEIRKRQDIPKTRANRGNWENMRSRKNWTFETFRDIQKCWKDINPELIEPFKKQIGGTEEFQIEM